MKLHLEHHQWTKITFWLWVRIWLCFFHHVRTVSNTSIFFIIMAIRFPRLWILRAKFALILMKGLWNAECIRGFWLENNYIPLLLYPKMQFWYYKKPHEFLITMVKFVWKTERCFCFCFFFFVLVFVFFFVFFFGFVFLLLKFLMNNL